MTPQASRTGLTSNRSIMRFTILCVLALVPVLHAGERHWQTGKWIDVNVKRRMVDFGPGASAPAMKAMADLRTYVIETDDLRIELEDVVQVNTRSIDAVIGLPVTFALEKNSVYVRDSDGVEHKLRVTKKTSKPKS